MPSFVNTLSPLERSQLKSSNRYLKIMQERIRKLVREGNLELAYKVGIHLLRRSRVFHIYLANQACKGWYWRISQKEWEGELRKFTKAVNHFKSFLEVKRFYLEKSNGKMRPIGAPAMWSKMVYLGIEKILRELIEHEIGDYQHCSVRGRGTQTASIALLEALKNNQQVYQFDLRSCWNKINPRLICGRLNSKFRGLGKWILSITLSTFPKLPERMYDEAEVYRWENAAFKGWLKRGFTQGSPLSPLLCTWAINWSKIGEIPGILMYADDGLVLRENDRDDVLSELNQPIRRVTGVEIATEKELGWSTQFRFLGLDYDTVKGEVRWKDKVMNYKESTLEELKVIVKYASYESSTPGKWDPVRDSYIWSKYRWMSIIKRLWQEKGSMELFREVPRVLLNMLIDNREDYYRIQEESTKGCLEMLTRLRKVRYPRGKRVLMKYQGNEVINVWNGSIKTNRAEWGWVNENWSQLGPEGPKLPKKQLVKM